MADPDPDNSVRPRSGSGLYRQNSDPDPEVQSRSKFGSWLYRPDPNPDPDVHTMDPDAGDQTKSRSKEGE